MLPAVGMDKGYHRGVGLRLHVFHDPTVEVGAVEEVLPVSGVSALPTRARIPCPPGRDQSVGGQRPVEQGDVVIKTKYVGAGDLASIIATAKLLGRLGKGEGLKQCGIVSGKWTALLPQRLLRRGAQLGK